MYHAINVITKGIKPSESDENYKTINLTELDIAFDNNIRYENVKEDDIADNQSKRQKIKINTSQNSNMFSRKCEHSDKVTEYLKIKEISFF
ncbi:3191_t:CDS:2 [Funneliformis caledonium]|uniref:3191_t:CDS:1 n=1 Tax=Funneliformis caledonium TaxID=1117310 RepID=A0A9N8WCW1_9GLOM|nr:3191_t:CDS:2 [Funneliformis caledonium]